MKSWLLDTNVISQLAPTKDGHVRAEPPLLEWLRDRTDVLYLSAVTVVEISAGIEKLRAAGVKDRAEALERWLDRILAYYGNRVLPLDSAVGKVAGALAERARANGRHPGFSDVLIAATAEAHEHCLLTRNIRHFEPLRLSISLADPLAPEFEGRLL
ncbi:type II toxin-antitoxin system VapC family toxin [Rhizobium terrae]|uniref:type II toxin-antitoxin system VapC family toxin n=1 Tax=Rhizobium terrae TaxID=2171756 RepID=UPI000E3C77ED|nr:type II toxin-antitoxin system VapC family toxin [Rhizobium terrae]